MGKITVVDIVLRLLGAVFCTNPTADRCVVPDIGGLRCEAVFRHACIGYRLRGKRCPAGKGHECQTC